MNKEYISKLAQLINEYPTLPIKAWVEQIAQTLFFLLYLC